MTLPLVVAAGGPAVQAVELQGPALRMYEDMRALHNRQAQVDPLAAICDAVGLLLRAFEAMVDEGGGPSPLGDPDRIDPGALPWLGQFVGVRVTEGSPPAQQAAEIWRAAGLRRGTIPAMREAVQAHLTGSRQVKIYEHYGGNPYRIRVEVLASEVVDAAAAEAAARSQKPGGLVMEWGVVTQPTWDDAAGDTWDDAASGTWDDDTEF